MQQRIFWYFVEKLVMIKKIICPTDFSVAATNAIEYAAELAQELNAELQLLNVQSLFPVIAIPVGMNINERVFDSSKSLAQTCYEINELFHIQSTYEIIATSEGLAKSISDEADENCLIVMGTNGVDSMYQYFFGSNTYQVIKKAKCHVLMVPEKVTYGTISKIVFAWSYETNYPVLISMLNELITIFNPKIIFTPLITFLHVSKHPSPLSNETFLLLKKEIGSEIKEKIKIEFEEIVSDDIPESINNYMEKSKSDILMMTVMDRGLIGNIFHHSVSRKITGIAEYPFLVMHV
ncbi:MAG: hypothetical protein A3F72_14365 [Bacteroidetes bacterium RIFCSPLOWO2_12_FULL_35_15]|nr:MAG: hypothetical protein A3F72_14365 [Bacteroidetes bacterium RIFCSPLOWO2_12_FULL_35_15]